MIWDRLKKIEQEIKQLKCSHSWHIKTFMRIGFDIYDIQSECCYCGLIKQKAANQKETEAIKILMTGLEEKK